MIAGSCAAIWRMPRNRPPAAADLALQHGVDIRQPQIGEADDALADPGLAAAPVALLGDRPDEFALADRPHLLGAAGPVAGAALDKDGGDDVVAGIDVGQQFVKQIAAARVVPQMMVRVDDRQPGFEDFFLELAEPLGVGQRAGIGARFDGHGGLRLHCDTVG
jgi:hypothetical protein